MVPTLVCSRKDVDVEIIIPLMAGLLVAKRTNINWPRQWSSVYVIRLSETVRPTCCWIEKAGRFQRPLVEYVRSRSTILLQGRRRCRVFRLLFSRKTGKFLPRRRSPTGALRRRTTVNCCWTVSRELAPIQFSVLPKSADQWTNRARRLGRLRPAKFYSTSCCSYHQIGCGVVPIKQRPGLGVIPTV